jgi:hypothetical protein
VVKRAALLIVTVLMAATLVLAGCGQQPNTAGAPADEPEQAGTASSGLVQQITPTAPGIIEIPSDDGHFEVIVRDGDIPRVMVALDDPAVVDAYYAANRKRIDSYLAQPKWAGKRIEVTMTFHKPLDWDAFAALRSTTGLQVNGYTLAELGPNGEKWALDHIAVPDEELLASVEREISTAGVQLLGVIVVQGTVEVDPSALGALASDPRVFAVDTAGAETAELMRQHGVQPGDTSGLMAVTVPSPYWDFDWTAP